MSDRIEFRVHVRVCADGSVYSLTSYEIEGGSTLDDVAQGEESYRDHVIAVSAPLPAYEPAADAHVTLPDPEPAGVTAEPVAAA